MRLQIDTHTCAAFVIYCRSSNLCFFFFHGFHREGGNAMYIFLTYSGLITVAPAERKYKRDQDKEGWKRVAASRCCCWCVLSAARWPLWRTHISLYDITKRAHMEAAAGDHEHTGASRGHTRPPYNSQVVVYTGAYTATHADHSNSIIIRL